MRMILMSINDLYVFFVVKILEKRGVYSPSVVMRPYVCQRGIHMLRGHPCVPRTLRNDICLRNSCVKLSAGGKPSICAVAICWCRYAQISISYCFLLFSALHCRKFRPTILVIGSLVTEGAVFLRAWALPFCSCCVMPG